MRSTPFTESDELQSHGRRAPRPLPPILKGSHSTDIPLSVSQRQWVSTGKIPSRDIRVPIVLRFEGRLNARAMSKAVAEAVDRNESLRTRFRTTGSEFRQEIHSADGFSISHVSLNAIAANNQIEAVWDHINRQYGEPFQLEEDPLKLTLFELNSKDHILAGFVSHFVFDGVSLGLFLGDVLASYRRGVLGFSASRPPELQYADFALWEAGWLSEHELAAAKEFWDAYLAKASPIEIPSSRSQLSKDAPVGLAQFKLPDEVFARGLEFARERRTTFNQIFLAALSVVLADSPENPTPYSYITRARPPKFNRTIGCFMQVRAMLPDTQDDPTFETLLLRTRSHLAATSDLRRPLPFQNSDRLRLGQILVNYATSPLAAPNQPFSAMGVGARVFHLPRGVKTRVNRNIQFTVSQTAAGLDGSIVYATDMFDEDRARNIGDRLIACIARAVDATQIHISELMQQPQG